MKKYEEIIIEATSSLNDGKVSLKDSWEDKYGKYINLILKDSRLNNAQICYEKLAKYGDKNFSFYIWTNDLKTYDETFYFRMRFKGQEIALVKTDINCDEVYLKILKKTKEEVSNFLSEVKKLEIEELFKEFKFNDNEEPYVLLPYDDELGKRFRSFFDNVSLVNKIRQAEHTLENNLFSELEKINCYPITLFGSLRYPMTTAFSSSKKNKRATLSKGTGGGIDILAWHKKDNTFRLTVIEVKTAYEESSKVLEQAISYAVFLSHLFKSETAHGLKWFDFLKSSNVDLKNSCKAEKLTMNVVVAMPCRKDNKENKSFELEELELDNGDKLVLHYMYFSPAESPNYIIENIDTSLNK